MDPSSESDFHSFPQSQHLISQRMQIASALPAFQDAATGAGARGLEGGFMPSSFGRLASSCCSSRIEIFISPEVMAREFTSPKSCLVTVGFGGSGKGTVVASDVASSASELGEGVRKSIASDVLIALILGVDMSSSSTS